MKFSKIIKNKTYDNKKIIKINVRKKKYINLKKFIKL